MKIELSLDELRLVVAALQTKAHESSSRAIYEQVRGHNGSYHEQLADRCNKLEHRLHNELEAAEHAENLLDNME